VNKFTPNSQLSDPHFARIQRDAEVEQQRSPRILERGNNYDNSEDGRGRCRQRAQLCYRDDRTISGQDKRLDGDPCLAEPTNQAACGIDFANAKPMVIPAARTLPPAQGQAIASALDPLQVFGAPRAEEGDPGTGELNKSSW
jgi:hypothetical protein